MRARPAKAAGCRRARHAIAVVCALVAGGCALEPELRAAAGIVGPARAAVLPWPPLQPLGAFRTAAPPATVPDLRPLNLRAADLRRRGATIAGPVLTAAERTRLLAALTP